MKSTMLRRPGTAAQLIAILAIAAPAVVWAQSTTRPPTKMTKHATGPFEVKLAPQPLAVADESGTRARMSIDKQFHGDLEAASKGEMLTGGTAVKGSAGYVAIEIVSGTLHGLKGSFILQHTGIMNRGTPQLIITVVPDSGTGQLTGIAGRMSINIEGGKHSYDLEYSLPE